MIPHAFATVIAASALTTGPAAPINYEQPEPVRLSLRDVARAADARVALSYCVTSDIACYHIYERRIKIEDRALYRVLTHRSCRRARVQSTAVFILTHEAGHAHGIYTESGANSYAYSNFRTVARKLKFRPAKLARLIPPLGGIASTWRNQRQGC